MSLAKFKSQLLFTNKKKKKKVPMKMNVKTGDSQK